MLSIAEPSVSNTPHTVQPPMPARTSSPRRHPSSRRPRCRQGAPPVGARAARAARRAVLRTANLRATKAEAKTTALQRELLATQEAAALSDAKFLYIIDTGRAEAAELHPEDYLPGYLREAQKAVEESAAAVALLGGWSLKKGDGSEPYDPREAWAGM